MIVETMDADDLTLLATEHLRPLRRVEFERLATAGCFDEEKVELLFGLVVDVRLEVSDVLPPLAG